MQLHLRDTVMAHFHTRVKNWRWRVGRTRGVQRDFQFHPRSRVVRYPRGFHPIISFLYIRDIKSNHRCQIVGSVIPANDVAKGEGLEIETRRAWMITNCEIGISFSSLSLSVQFSIRILTWNVEFVHLLTFKICYFFVSIVMEDRSWSWLEH